MFLSHQQAKKIIRQAMRDKAPRMFHSLQAAGKLDQAVNDRALQYNEMALEGMNEPISSNLIGKAGQRPHQEVAAGIDQGFRAAHEQALASVLEFPSEDESSPPA
jgi:hypothetical protein